MEAPKLNYYNSITLEYLYSEDARRDQFDECWVIPHNAKEAEITSEKKGFTRIFNQSKNKFEYAENRTGRNLV